MTAILGTLSVAPPERLAVRACARAWLVVAACAAALACVSALAFPRDALAAWPTNPSTNLVVSNAAGVQAYHGAITDGQGGMFIAWADSRTGTNDIYVQHIGVAGAALWNVAGRLVCGAAGDQDQPVLVGDGTGGVIVAWRDFRNGVTGDIYAQRIDATSTPAWPTNGVAVCKAAGEQAFPVIVSDDRPLAPGPVSASNPLGAIIAWEDWRSTITIRAQRLDASGAVHWTSNGMSLSASAAPQFDPACVADGSGGAYVVWSQQGVGGYDIAGQHVESDGALQWNLNGTIVSAAARRAGASGRVPRRRERRHRHVGGPSRRRHRRVRTALELLRRAAVALGRAARLHRLRRPVAADDRGRRHRRGAPRVDRPALGQRHLRAARARRRLRRMGHGRARRGRGGQRAAVSLDRR
ncbi:MAG: hypothetical protein IPJ04_02930 [Candidatus Eisenbacteria bacterium]|nr:hypothetical protein [Candidatus Eisenbacteria bacterium]